MEAYRIYRKGKSEEEYLNELESICEEAGIPNLDHTSAEYAWKAVIVVSRFAGQKVITSILQRRRFPTRDAEELSGSIRAYFYTPNSQSSGHLFTLEDFDAESAAWTEVRRSKGTLPKESVEQNARKLLSKWWNDAVAKVLTAPQGEYFDVDGDADELLKYEYENFEKE